MSFSRKSIFCFVANVVMQKIKVCFLNGEKKESFFLPKDFLIDSKKSRKTRSNKKTVSNGEQYRGTKKTHFNYYGMVNKQNYLNTYVEKLKKEAFTTEQLQKVIMVNRKPKVIKRTIKKGKMRVNAEEIIRRKKIIFESNGHPVQEKPKLKPVKNHAHNKDNRKWEYKRVWNNKKQKYIWVKQKPYPIRITVKIL